MSSADDTDEIATTLYIDFTSGAISAEKFFTLIFAMAAFPITKFVGGIAKGSLTIENSDDILLEVMRRFMVQIKSGSLDLREVPCFPWLFTVAGNVIKDLWRKQRTDRTKLDNFRTISESVSWHPALHESFDLMQAVEAALDALPDDLNQIMHLWIHLGFSQEEIAEMLHSTREAIQKKIARAKRILRQDEGLIEFIRKEGEKADANTE